MVCISHISHASYIPFPSPLPWFHHPDNR
jgi:hypothetical protein